MNVLPKRPLPVPPDHFVTEEQVAAHVGAITAQLNAVRHAAPLLLLRLAGGLGLGLGV